MTTPAETALPSALPPGWTVTASQAGEWEELGPGVHARALAAGQFLVQFEPGATWPREDVHDGPEELLILAGGLHLAITGTSEDHYVREGDRVRAETGTRHRPLAGPDGCRVLATYP